MKTVSKNLPIKRITPDDAQYFFGYYDLQPYNASETLHLTHKATFRNKLQEKGDSAEVGFIDLSTDKYEKIDTTFAWNFQQGAMLQWNSLSHDREVIYNTVHDGEYHGVVTDIYNGKQRFLDKPIANVSRDGKYALSVNMSRLYDFRPGYGYAWPTDPDFYKKHSKDDGVYLIDMESGKSKLVISLDELWEFTGKYFSKDEKIIINHITFNPDASRFIMLVRNFHEKGVNHVTALVTASRDGSDIYLLSDYGLQSHYWWMNNDEVIFFSDGKELEACRGWYNTYVFKDKTHDGYMFADGFFDIDTHMSFSPDGRFMLSDTYPNLERYKRLRIYSPEKGACVTLGYFRELENVCGDVRCDLHPRWGRSGSSITFDSVHEGFRGVYEIKLGDTINELFEE